MGTNYSQPTTQKTKTNKKPIIENGLMDWKKVWDLSQALNFQKEKFSICPVGYRAEVTRDQQNPIPKTKHYQINKSEFHHVLWVIYHEIEKNLSFVLRFSMKNTVEIRYPTMTSIRIESKELVVSELNLQNCVISHQHEDNGIAWQIDNAEFNQFYERKYTNRWDNVENLEQEHLQKLNLSSEELQRVGEIIRNSFKVQPQITSPEGYETPGEIIHEVQEFYYNFPGNIIELKNHQLKSANTAIAPNE